MIWLLGGYMWLYVHRPFEIFPILGDLQVERLYMLLLILVWVASPAKAFWPNRLHRALAAFQEGIDLVKAGNRSIKVTLTP